ncbi:TetR/AcrR family transcriptional regulator [Bacillus sp. IITD106]|nr:TetR/AcrR family transcriptional regulator [Bacillus sp. IITD106]
MPRTEQENKRIRETQRNSILEAAKHIFAQKGWATTIADIAAAANVSQGLIYHYFANKEAVICELLSQTMQSDLDVFQRVMQSGDTATKRLEILISSMLKSRQEQINQFGITVQAAKKNSPSNNELEIMRRIFKNLNNNDSDAKDLHELMMKRFQSIHDIILQLIVEGQEREEFAKDAPSKLALMIFQCIQSMTTLALDQPDEYEKHYPYTEIIMRMLKPNNQ